MIEDLSLKICPCGESPKELEVIDTLSGKWAQVVPGCCGEWTIEYRNGYATGAERYRLAVLAWNASPRAKCLQNE